MEKKINIVDFKESLPDETTREVKEDEVLCDACEGFGVIYDIGRKILKTCPDCSKGKIKVCKHCGKKLKRGYYRCNCDEAKKEYEKQKIKNALKKRKEATKVSLAYIFANDLKLYDPIDNRYISDIEDDLDIDWAFATYTETLNLDAYRILDNASTDLHESIYDSFDDKDYDKLQEVCDELNKKYRDHRTFYPDFSRWVDLSEYSK